MLERRRTEIDQQSPLETCCLEIIEYLRFFDGGQLLQCFQLNDYAPETDEVRAIRDIQHRAPVRDRDHNFTLKGDLLHAEFPFQSTLINGFQKAVPQFAVNGHRRADDGVGFRITHHPPPLVVRKIAQILFQVIICAHLRNLRIGNKKNAEAIRALFHRMGS
jgi:hypothetical protein